MQELNRWIAKVKQSQDKQLQVCSKISQMSQQICSSRQKYRKLQYEYKQLQKIKIQLQKALTSNKQNQDSMMIYFDRLSAYEKEIKQLQDQLKDLQYQNKKIKRQNQEKIHLLQTQNQNTNNQWKILVEQMNKQKSIIKDLQKEIQQYYKPLLLQGKFNQYKRQSENHKQKELDEYYKSNLNQNTYKSKRLSQNNNNQISQIKIEPYSYVNSSKIAQKSNRSMSLQDKKIYNRNQNDNMTSYQSHQYTTRPYYTSTLKQKAQSQLRLIYHSQRQNPLYQHRNQNTMLDKSLDTNYNQYHSRANSLGINKNESYQNSLSKYQLSNKNNKNEDSSRIRMHNNKSQINDEKKLLMQKLNILKPQDTNLKIHDKNVSSLYNKTYRQYNTNSQSILKLNQHQSKASLVQPNQVHHKLQIQRSRLKQEKQNINDMIIKRYSNLIKKT